MKRKSGLLLLLFVPLMGWGQLAPVTQTLSNPDNEPMPVHPVPSNRQIRWNETEFYAFFHYGMNTYTDAEWGSGAESESTFAPTAAPDPEQWLTAVKAAGMKGGIAVVKHHDGFCLWPSESTTHDVENAGNSYGRATNIPRDFGIAARKLGLKYGFYISPWDRNSYYYGTDTYVTDVFLKQCLEVAAYGSDQFEMWFDGANGGSGYYGGRNTTITVDRPTYYDVPNLRARIHKMAPDCVLWGVGGEARWIGNEDGYAGETNWMMMNYTSAMDGTTTGEEDGWWWFPGESDAKSTSGGWFYHSGQTYTSAERLFQMYLETVGRNSTWILNCPPDKAGQIPDAQVSILQSLGDLLKSRLGVSGAGQESTTAATDYALSAAITASETRTAGANRTFDVSCLTDGDSLTYWGTNDGVTSATITLTWDEARTIRYVQLMEPIRLGQRIKDFKIEYTQDGSSWTELATSVLTTTVGYKRIIPLNGSTSSSYGSGYSATGLRITIQESKAAPLLSNISVF